MQAKQDINAIELKMLMEGQAKTFNHRLEIQETSRKDPLALQLREKLRYWQQWKVHDKSSRKKRTGYSRKQETFVSVAFASKQDKELKSLHIYLCFLQNYIPIVFLIQSS